MPLQRLMSDIGFADLIKRARRVHSASSDFDLNPEFGSPAGGVLRAAAVLLPFVETSDGLHLILTKRSTALRHHPGQIAFPGGKVDAGDAGPHDAALREAEEEIGLARGNVEILADMPVHETITGFRITPVLGRVRATFDPSPEAGEVDEIFMVPYGFLGNSDVYSVQSRFWQGKRRFYYTAPWGPYYIWGATARILRALAETGDA